MGLLDREYYREEEGGPFMAWLRQGLITKILVTLGALAFIIQIASQSPRFDDSTSSSFTGALSLVGGKVVQGEFWRLLTYAFVHPVDSLLPLLFNLTVLWAVGRAVEDRMGRGRYITFYLLATMIGGAAMVAAAKFGLNEASMEKTHFLGAAAPLTGLLVWLLLQSPHERVLFFYALPVPIWVLLAVAVGFDLLPAIAVGFDFWGLIKPDPLGIDGRRLTWVGHAAAAVFAVGVHFASRPRRTVRSRGAALRRPQRERPDLRIFRDEPPSSEAVEESPVAAPATTEADELLEAQLDAVLAKVADKGQSSLTPAEHAILRRASEVYRKRRR
jgi:membrane associated rhomboid family serine protease